MTGKENAMARMVWISAIVNGMLNYVLIQYYGAIGAAIATLIARMALETGLWHYARLKVGIRCDAFFWGNSGGRKVSLDDRQPHVSKEHEE